jgi:ankyrin repeat protein
MLTLLVSVALQGCAPRASSEASATPDRPTLPAGPEGSLLSAAVNGDIFSVERLLNEGANVNARASNGATPLMGAAYRDYPRTTRLLIARGGEVNARSADGLTALHYAAGAGNTEIVDVLLMAGADPNASSLDGETPLMRAARSGRDEAVKRLVAGGATAEAMPAAGPR